MKRAKTTQCVGSNLVYLFHYQWLWSFKLWTIKMVLSLDNDKKPYHGRRLLKKFNCNIMWRWGKVRMRSGWGMGVKIMFFHVFCGMTRILKLAAWRFLSLEDFSACSLKNSAVMMTNYSCIIFWKVRYNGLDRSLPWPHSFPS